MSLSSCRPMRTDADECARPREFDAADINRGALPDKRGLCWPAIGCSRARGREIGEAIERCAALDLGGASELDTARGERGQGEQRDHEQHAHDEDQRRCAVVGDGDEMARLAGDMRDRLGGEFNAELGR